MGFQLVTISGWCSLEPRVHSFERNGEQRSLVKVGVAVPVGFGDNKTMTFFDVVAFEGDSNFKFMSEHVKRGDNVVAVGELKPPRTYVSNGETKVALEVTARSFDRPSKAPAGEGAGDGQQEQGEQQDGQQPAAAAAGNGGQQRPTNQGVQQRQGAAPQGQGRGQAPPAQQRTAGNYQGTRQQTNRQAPPQGQRGPAPQGSRGGNQGYQDSGDNGPF